MGRNGRAGSGVKPATETSIEITFQYQGVRCRERIAIKPTPANLKRVEQHKAAIEYAIREGTFDYAATFPNSKRATELVRKVPELMTLGIWLTTWLERNKLGLKSSTFIGYRKIVNGQLIPALGNKTVQELKRKDIRAWFDTRLVGNKRFANILSCLRTALDAAVVEELIEDNPLVGWSYSRKEAPKEEDVVDPFRADEQAAILAALNGQGRNLIEFAFWTGLRTSELVALEWGDIDWLAGEFRVRRAQTQMSKEPESTKTKSGRRTVRLLGPALEALTRQKAFTFLADGRVFHNPRTNEPWLGDGPIRKTFWIPALKKAGVRYRYPYQTRHTYASMMLSAGEHPMWVAKQMGHGDWTMIARVYGKWMPSADLNAGDKAVELFASKRNDNLMTTTAVKPLR